MHKQVDCVKNANEIVYPTNSLPGTFSKQFLQKLDSHTESTYEIVYVWSKATADFIKTEVSFKYGLAIGENFSISLESDEFKKLHQVHNGDSQAVKNAYIDKVKTTVEKNLKRLDQNKLVKSHSATNANTYSFGYTPEIANDMSRFFDGLSNDEQTLVKIAYQKNNIRTINGFIEYIKQNKVK
ncbi:putative RNA uridine N3 methyltransferase [Colwellia sp. 1_MG-2023]|uniref:putative RNA uridine N3 methyltransferase n=1 Tax=Colwellia sp. 1_MG-2023 TaxID=3062649 RepID=UPI0026E16AFA|nr:putative RNA uridine N3 methyltransferase [Colwellia sp. 1_MG-2023]MDO6447168.1 putative RNA uridine N3 methyltransferase [Colwellia sp. 1_MG-2023]